MLCDPLRSPALAVAPYDPGNFCPHGMLSRVLGCVDDPQPECLVVTTRHGRLLGVALEVPASHLFLKLVLLHDEAGSGLHVEDV